MTTNTRPPHPGKILKERFLDPLGLTPAHLARSIGVPTRRISELLRGKRNITPDTAIRLGLFFDVPPAWWLEMQARHDTEGVPLIEELRGQVARFEGLLDVLVTPGGVQRREKVVEAGPGVLLVKVSDELVDRLRAQAALDPPRAPRRVRTITYADGTTALVGSDE